MHFATLRADRCQRIRFGRKAVKEKGLIQPVSEGTDRSTVKKQEQEAMNEEGSRIAVRGVGAEGEGGRRRER